jgi:hypothetical protein
VSITIFPLMLQTMAAREVFQCAWMIQIEIAASFEPRATSYELQVCSF